MVVGQLLGFLSFEIYGKLEEHFQLHAQLFFLLVPELEPTLLSRTIDSSFFLLARRNLWFFSQMKRASCLLSKFLIFGKIDLGKKLESNKGWVQIWGKDFFTVDSTVGGGGGNWYLQ